MKHFTRQEIGFCSMFYKDIFAASEFNIHSFSQIFHSFAKDRVMKQLKIIFFDFFSNMQYTLLFIKGLNFFVLSLCRSNFSFRCLS